MINRRARMQREKSSESADYRRVFITRVHQLLELGYRRTNAKAFQSYQEPEITGELVGAMDRVIDDTAAPRWVRQFSVHDDPPVTGAGRLGKARKRLDIKIVSTQRWPRSRFSFEAKRLGKHHPVANYLGPEGLGRFLAGHYAPEEIDAGMLGYVQSDSPHDWAARIATNIGEATKELSLMAGTSWQKHPLPAGPAHTYHTRHSRKTPGRDLDVYHTLLAFC